MSYLAMAAGLVVGAAFLALRVLARATGDAADVRRKTLRAGVGTVADAEEGQSLRLVGTIGGSETFEAPFTGRRCVYLDVSIEEHLGGHSDWYVLVREVHAAAAFTIHDGTGTALIDPVGARIAIDRDAGLRSQAVDLSTPAAAELLRKHGTSPGGVLGKRRMRYCEAALEIGELVAVTGVGVREPDPDAVADVASYRDGPPTRLRLGGSKKAPVLITDAPAATRG